MTPKRRLNVVKVQGKPVGFDSELFERMIAHSFIGMGVDYAAYLLRRWSMGLKFAWSLFSPGARFLFCLTVVATVFGLNADVDAYIDKQAFLPEATKAWLKLLWDIGTAWTLPILVIVPVIVGCWFAPMHRMFQSAARSGRGEASQLLATWIEEAESDPILYETLAAAYAPLVAAMGAELDCRGPWSPRLLVARNGTSHATYAAVLMPLPRGTTESTLISTPPPGPGGPLPQRSIHRGPYDWRLSRKQSPAPGRDDPRSGDNLCMVSLRRRSESEGVCFETRPALYGEIIDSCDSLREELLLFWRLKGRHRIDPSRLLNYLPWRRHAHSGEVGGNPLLSARSRAAGIGILGTTTYRVASDAFHVFRARRSARVGTYERARHVVPSGMFNLLSPYVHGDMRLMLKAEFCEELFDVEEAQILGKSEWRLLVAGIAEPRMGPASDEDVEIAITGVTMDLLTLRPEVCHLIKIEEEGWHRRFRSTDDESRAKRMSIRFNWEGDMIQEGGEARDHRPPINASMDVPDAVLISEFPPELSVQSGAASLWAGLSALQGRWPPRRVRAVYLDIEGCITPGKRVAPDLGALEALADAISRVRALGCEVGIASGRAVSFVESTAQILGLSDSKLPFVCDGGATLYMPQEDRTSLLVPANAPDSEFLRQLPTGVFRLEPGKQGCVTLYPSGGATVESLFKLVERVTDPGKVLVRRSADAVDVTPVGIDKGSGILQAVKRVGIGADEVVVVGDQENDLPAVATGCWLACPRNALPEVKRQAIVVADSNTTAGVVEILTALATTGLCGTTSPVLTVHRP